MLRVVECPPGTTQSTNSVGLAVCLSNSLSAGNTPENCGGQRCQSSYNGVGVAVCLNAQCSVGKSNIHGFGKNND